MKTKKRIKKLEAKVENLQQTVASLILRDFKLEIPATPEWKLVTTDDQPTATATSLFLPESITIK